MRVAMFGATGFVGRYLVDALLGDGHELSVLVRPDSLDKLARATECQVTFGDLASSAAIDAVVSGCDGVIYSVGILEEDRSTGATFEELQYQAVCRVIDAARRSDVGRFVLISANGVKIDGTPYQQTKLRAELELTASGLDYTIFRPSVIFGDPRGAMEFATQLARDMVRPPLPAVAFFNGWMPGRNPVLLSPVHVQDVADAVEKSLRSDDALGQVIDLGGPDTLAWSDIVRRIGAAIGRRKFMLPMPIGLMKLAATLFGWIPGFPVTRDQLTMLAENNVAGVEALQAMIGRDARPFVPENLQYLND